MGATVSDDCKPLFASNQEQITPYSQASSYCDHLSAIETAAYCTGTVLMAACVGATDGVGASVCGGIGLELGKDCLSSVASAVAGMISNPKLAALAQTGIAEVSFEPTAVADNVCTATADVNALNVIGVTPASADLQLGQTQLFTAARSVTWTILEGPNGGTLGTITSTSATTALYTAPSVDPPVQQCATLASYYANTCTLTLVATSTDDKNDQTRTPIQLSLADNNGLEFINSFSPSAITARSMGQDVYINGIGFLPHDQVYFNGHSEGNLRYSTYVSPTQLKVSLFATDFATVGDYLVVVQHAYLPIGSSTFVFAYLPVVTSPPTTPSVPVPGYPGTATDPGSPVTTIAPTISWTGSGADKYDITISKSPYNTAPVYENDHWGGGYTSLDVPFGRLTSNSTFRWRIRAHNSTGWSDWSSPYLYFTVQAGNVPPLPVPLSPGAGLTGQLAAPQVASAAAGEPVSTTTPTVNWNGSGADKYEIAIAKSPYGPGNVVFEKRGLASGSTSYTIPDGVLQNGVKYSWDVQAINAAGKSGRSNPLYFAVQSPGSTDLSITSTSLSPSVAAVGMAYVSQGVMAATGGTAPYYWSVAGLPSGMQMYTNSGALFGTPTAAGNFNPVVTVRDSSIPQRVAAQSMTFTVYPAGPTVLSLSPSSLPIGSAAQTLTLNGVGFISTSVVSLSGSSRATTYVSATLLTINLTAVDLATVGSYPVVVTNVGGAGGTSTAVNFAVVPINPQPTVTGISPFAVPEGSPARTLTINGTGFVPLSAMTYGGSSRTVTYVSDTQLTIQLSAADQVAAGSYPVVVTNPAPGGGASTAVAFPVVSVKSVGQWTWMGGGNTTYTALGSAYASVYGTLGAEAAANHPGAREYAMSWTGNDGNLWLFGGNGEDSTLTERGDLNDLWRYNPSTGAWAWMSGTNTLDTACSYGFCEGSAAHYGTRGVPSTANTPGGRKQAVTWVDSKGYLWLFGGQGYDSAGTAEGFLNDLWRFNPSTREWTWISGADTLGCSQWCGRPTVYGALGVSDPKNMPGGRYAAVGWIDKNDNLWFFGGDGIDASGMQNQFNDLWRFDPSSQEWTWMNGPQSESSGVYGQKNVPDAANIPGNRNSAISWTDNDGNFWLFGGSGEAAHSGGALNDLWEYIPGTGRWTWVSGSSDLQCAVPLTNGYCNSYNPATGVYGAMGVPAPANVPGGRYYSVSWTGSDGNLWLFGGWYGNTTSDGTHYNGFFNDLWRFNPSTKQWTWMGGSDTVPCPLSGFVPNYVSGCEVLGIYGVKGTASHANAPGSRIEAVGWADQSGNLWLFGGAGADSQSINDELNDLWRYQP